MKKWRRLNLNKPEIEKLQSHLGPGQLSHLTPSHPLVTKIQPFFCQSTEELFLRRTDARLSPSAFARALVELFETESRPALKHPQTRCLGKGIWPAEKLEACETTQKGHILKKTDHSFNNEQQFFISFKNAH